MTYEEFDKKYMLRLNEQQKEAVRSVDGATLLLAVPGSGKTTVLVTRLGYMIFCRNINPSSILTMTYTVAATKDMRQRFVSMFGNECGAVEFRTINGVSSKIIDFYSRNFGKGSQFSLIEDGEGSRIIRQLYQKFNKEYPTDSTVKDIGTAITYIKNMMLTAEEIKNLDVGVDNIAEIYKEYCAELRSRRLMDYDDQLSYALTVLKNYPPVLEYFQEKFPFICVDESQDTSKIQHEIIKILASKHKNIFMVGDEDQSIYGFRAAYPEALMNFEKDYENAKILFMEKNYRSAGKIITAANLFVSKNRFRRDKKMESTRGAGVPINVIKAESRESQFKYLFNEAQNCADETAVLYRNNDSAVVLIDMFERNGISYNCKKFDESFFSNRIVNDVTDIISFAYNQNDAEAFMRIYYKLGCGITKNAAIYACEQCEKRKTSILKELIYSPDLKQGAKAGVCGLAEIFPKLLNDSGEDAVIRIWNELNYGRYVENNKLDSGKFSILRMVGKHERSAQDLLRRVSELKEIIQNHENKKDTKFILSTIHSSKGLEYNKVYLLDIFDRIIPLKNKNEARSDDDIRIYEEERRLYYVAMTRARNELYIFDCFGTESEFNSEVLAFLPRPVIDNDDIFSPFQQDLRGKIFNHKSKGKGRVIAQCGDRLLIEFDNFEVQLLTVEQMANERSRDVKYELPKVQKVRKSSKPKNSIDRRDSSLNDAEVEQKLSKANVGSKVKHCTFGAGEIINLENDIASIRFDKTAEVKRMGLVMCLKNGLMDII